MHTIQPDGFGRYNVISPNGTIRLGNLSKRDALVAADYFNRVQ
jgi:hypothetical protein